METLLSKLFGEGKQLKDLTTEELARYKNASYMKNEEKRKVNKKKSFAEETFGKRYIDLTDAEKAMHKNYIQNGIINLVRKPMKQYLMKR